MSVVSVVCCVLYGSSSISEEHASNSLSVDSAATDLHYLCSDWLESQPRTLSFLCHACIADRQQLSLKANDQ